MVDGETAEFEIVGEHRHAGPVEDPLFLMEIEGPVLVGAEEERILEEQDGVALLQRGVVGEELVGKDDGEHLVGRS